MPIISEEHRATCACEIKLSSRSAPLFFALMLPLFWLDSAYAQKAEGGWSVSSEKTKITSVDEVVDSSSEASVEQTPTADQQPLANDHLLANQESDIDPVSALAERSNINDDVINQTGDPQIPTTPQIDLDPQLRNNLERQFKQIIEIQENEDAFSENLGEAYLGYGQALLKAGRLDEARKMLANALHISKINNGVNSMEQRPVLRAMFEMNLARANIEEAEANLKRIIWLEKSFPQNRDDFSFDMVIRLGNQYLDAYLYRPSVSQTALLQLNTAERYFKYAIDRYGARSMDELFMPYGELALVNYYKSKIQVDVARPAYQHPRQQNSISALEKQQRKVSRYPGNAFARAERYLTEYLLKSKSEGRTEDIVLALLNLGDINLLFARDRSASDYYELAWTESQNLSVDHSLVLSFEQPQILPAFNYSRERGTIDQYQETMLVPITFSLSEFGRVKKFADVDEPDTQKSVTKRARRVAKRLRFRPVIENGRMIAVGEFTHPVQVKARRQQANNDQGE